MTRKPKAPLRIRSPIRRVSWPSSGPDEGPRKVDAEAVSWAYRLVLGREPDPDGAARNLLYFEDQPIDDLALHMLACEEFRLGSLYRRTMGFDQKAPIWVSLDDFSIWVHADDSEIGGQILAQQQYEPHVTAQLRALLETGDTFVDVGANIGWFTLLGASVVGPTGKVIAAEPNPGNLMSLSNSIIGNAFTWVDVLPYAVGSEVTTMRLLAGRGTNGYFDMQARSEHDGWRDGTMVPVRPLDDLLGDIGRLDVLKVDVEGAEGLVVDGAAQVLDAQRPRLLCEFSPESLVERSGRTGDRFVDQLIEIGYAVCHLTGSGQRVELSDGAAAVRAQTDRGGTHIDLVCEWRRPA